MKTCQTRVWVAMLMQPFLRWFDRQPTRYLLVLFAVAVLAWALLIACVSRALAGDMTIGIEPPADTPLTYELHCVKIESIKLEVIPDRTWGGLPTWRSVKGSARVEPCPASNGHWLSIPTELHRNYQIHVLLVKRDAQGETVSARALPPYAWFDSGRSSRPRGPVILSI